MADNTLQFETRVDLSGLNTGMTQASASVGKFGNDAKTAMAAAAAATNQLADAQRQLGAAAAQGNAQAAAVIAEYQQAVVDTTAAVERLSVVEQQEERVVRQSISTRMAAGAELRILEGNAMGSTRALAALITQFPALAAAAQTLFTAFAAVAAVEVLIQIAQKLHAVALEFDAVAQAEKRAATEVPAAIQAMQDATDKASVSARDLFENQFGHVSALKYDLEHLRLTVNSDDVTKITQAQQKIADLQRQIAAGTSQVQIITPGPHGEAVVGQKQVVSDAAKAATIDLTAASIQLDTARLQLRNDTDALRTAEIQYGEAQDAEADKVAAAALKAARARMTALEVALAQQELINGKSAAEEEAYWQKYLNSFAAFPEIYRAIADKIIAAKHQVADEFGKDVLKMVEDGQREIELNEHISEEVNKTYTEITRQQDAAEKAQQEFNAVLAKAEEISAHNAAAMAAATVTQDKAIGSMSALGAAHATAAIHAQEYADKLAALRAQLDAINAETPTTQAGVSDQERRSLAITNQIQQTKGQASVSAIGDTTSQAQAIASPFLTAFQDINNGFLQVTNKMILGTQSISRDFAEMGANLVVSVADGFEKMLAKQIEFGIRSLALKATNVAQQNAVDATGAATSTAIAHSASVAQGFDAAKTAFKNTYAQVSGWPFVGPILAPILASGAFAAVAAFETGGIIPNTGIAMVHANEAVLPAPLTNFLMSAATNNNSASATMTNNNYGMSDQGFRRMATRNAEHMVATVHSGLRKMGRA